MTRSTELGFRSRRRLGLRDGVVLTAPLVVGLAYLLIAAAVDYHRALQFDDYWAAGTSVEGRFLARAGGLVRLFSLQRLRQPIDLDEPEPGLVRIQVDPAILDRAYRDPNFPWSAWLDANLIEAGGRLLPVRLRKRGDNSVHWLTEKKTLTVRTTRSDFFKGFRSFGLSGKDVLTAFVANRLAQEFDLLAPFTTVVPVVINNQFAGMYRFIETVDESFLRPLGRMPGNVFRGDAAERGDYYKGTNRDLFANPAIWDRVALNDRPTGAGAGQLQLLIEDLNGGDFASHLRLMGRLDRAELARLFAFLLLVGDPFHMDGVHNQLWYEDPSTALLHPIPWDIRLLPLADPPRMELNGLFRELLRDPLLVDAILRELSARLADGGKAWVATGDSLARGMWSRYREGFRYDSLRGGLIPPLGYPGQVRELLAANARVLVEWLANAEAASVAGRAGADGLVVDIETRGFAGVELTGIELGLVAARPELRLDQNRNGALDAEDPAVPGRWEGGRFVPDAPIPLLAAWHGGQPDRDGRPPVGPGTQHYRLFVRGATDPTVKLSARNRYTGQPVELRPWTGGAAIAASGSYHPWQYPRVRGRLHRLAGSVRLDSTLRLSAADTLVIEPGTTLRLGPDVSLVSRGRVLAVGTPERPITVTRADPERPWGAFTLLGAGSDSSRLSHISFEWGGGALVDRIEYIGMVNVHRARGVLVSHATFRDNLRSDDTFHALHSDLVLRDSRFVRANSDALDFDLSTGVIADNSFEGSGGDAIDLMGSAPLIRGNRIQRAGDKGISVGEASDPVIIRNRIESSRRGIEVKDRSEPVVIANELLGNGVGIVEDRKNWRYGGGGWATVIQTALGGNLDSLELDPYSRITLEADSLPDAERLLGSAPLASARFAEDFESHADGWRGTSGTDVFKLEQSLYAAAEGRVGGVGTAVAWNLAGGSAPATLLLQLAARNLDSASVVLHGPDGAVERRLALGEDPAYFRLIRVELPPRRYDALVIRFWPRPRIEKLVREPGWTELKPGQLWLRGFDLYGGSR